MTNPTWNPAEIGWNDFFFSFVQPDETVARVAAVHRGAVDAWTPEGMARMRQSDPVAAIGDWVVYDGDGIIRVLPRKTSLSRQGARESVHEQVLAANFDVVLIVTSMNKDFNPQRLLRTYAALAGSKARVVLVLSKADLDLAGQGRYLRILQGDLPDLPVIVTSAMLDMGIDALREAIRPGETAVLLGSSGTGKSSLANALIGEQRQFVQSQREADDRGRHTTTVRELLQLPGGGVLLDSPGIRALKLWDGANLDEVFSDVVQLSGECRFRDCSHEQEPGCAVQAAIERGDLSAGRLKSWRKLERETHRQAVRRNARAKREEGRQFARMVRAHKKDRW